MTFDGAPFAGGRVGSQQPNQTNMNTKPLVVTLKNGASMHGTPRRCLAWLNQQTRLRPEEILPATVGLSPFEDEAVADASGVQWAHEVTVEVVPVCDGWAVFGLSGAEWARFHTEREANEWAQEQGYVVADLRFAPAPLDNHAKRVDTAPGYVA